MPPETWEEHRPHLTNTARTQLPHGLKDDDQDVVQNVALRMAESGNEITNIGYLMTAVRNEVVDLIRHERAQKRGGGHTVQLDTDMFQNASPDPSEAVEHAEEVQRLQDAIPRLPESLRAIVEARLAGDSYADIADHLHIPPGTVKSRLTRAHEELRSLLHA